MEWLVHLEVVDADVLRDPEAARALAAREASRAAELVATGLLRRVWRDTGRWASWSLWDAPDATAFHAAVASLPAWRHCRVTVHPLAGHPNDPGQASATT